MTAPKTICITGGTGLLGKGMEETALRGYHIVSVHNREYTVDDTKATHVVLDVRNKDQVLALFEKYEFEAVVHAAGIASVDYVEAHRAEGVESNVIGTYHVASACLRTGCHMIYISSNAVFDGSSAPYRESDPVRPVNRYGEIKAACEQLVQVLLEDCTVVRPILMYGWNHAIGRLNPATWIISKLMKGEPIQVVDDVRENPLYNRNCGEALWEAIRRKPRGILHLAGAEVVNRYAFALAVADMFDLDASLIEPVPSSFFPSIAPRPKNTSFVTDRMEQDLGVTPLGVREGLRLMKEHMRLKV
jgi:dTDP-4-dehydrorhamnose reductase